MAIRKRIMILRIMSESVSGKDCPFFNRGQSVAYEAGPKALKQGPFWPVSDQPHFLAVDLLHPRHKMGDAIGKAEIDRALSKPEFATEKVRMFLQPGAAAIFDMVYESFMNLGEDGL